MLLLCDSERIASVWPSELEDLKDRTSDVRGCVVP